MGRKERMLNRLTQRGKLLAQSRLVEELTGVLVTSAVPLPCPHTACSSAALQLFSTLPLFFSQEEGLKGSPLIWSRSHLFCYVYYIHIHVCLCMCAHAHGS